MSDFLMKPKIDFAFKEIMRNDNISYRRTFQTTRRTKRR